MENLRELVKHPGWQEYLDVIEDNMEQAFMSLFQLEASKPDNFIKFVELKSRIDQLRDITYFVELQIAKDPEEQTKVNESFGKRFRGLLKKLIGGSK